MIMEGEITDGLPDVLNVAEVAAFLRLHPSSVYKMIARAAIPYFSVGGAYRFNRQALELWLSQPHKPTDDEEEPKK